MYASALGKMPADVGITLRKVESLLAYSLSASRVMIGRDLKLQQQRGEWTKLDNGRWALATVHPSFVIRSRIGGGFDEAYARFVADLKRMKRPPT